MKKLICILLILSFLFVLSTNLYCADNFSFHSYIPSIDKPVHLGDFFHDGKEYITISCIFGGSNMNMDGKFWLIRADQNGSPDINYASDDVNVVVEYSKTSKSTAKSLPFMIVFHNLIPSRYKLYFSKYLGPSNLYVAGSLFTIPSNYLPDYNDYPFYPLKSGELKEPVYTDKENEDREIADIITSSNIYNPREDDWVDDFLRSLDIPLS